MGHSVTELVAPSGHRRLTAERFQGLTDIPAEFEWFANLGKPSTRRAYRAALGDFTRFGGIPRPNEFRSVTRANFIAWHDDLAGHALSSQTVRHHLAALTPRSSTFATRTPYPQPGQVRETAVGRRKARRRR